MSQKADRPPVAGTGRDPVLVSRRLSKWFGQGDGLVRAVDEVDFEVRAAETVDSAATLEVLRLFDRLRVGGQTLVIVTHDSRVAATADRLVSMRDGALVDETRLSGGTRGNLGALAGLAEPHRGRPVGPANGWL